MKPLALLVGALLLTTPCRNPILGPGLDTEIADPYVLKFNGEYYLYSTGNPIVVWHSLDLVHWTAVGPVLQASTVPGAWNGQDVWAPEVTYRNGRFYLYYTATVKDPDWHRQEAERRVGVAVADSPTGPFVDSGHPVSVGWAIDGDVLHDPDNGRDWLFYSTVDEAGLHGAGLAVDELLAPNRTAGHPTIIVHGTEPWEDKDANPYNGTLRYTNEGPTALKRDGRYYVMYSGGSWDVPTYSLAVASAPAVLGPYSKQDPVILHSNRFVEAPGHNCVVPAPNNVDEECLYHARVYPFLDPWNRELFVDRLNWHHGRMEMDAPSLGFRPPPDRPAFEDRFDMDGPLSSAWTTRSGTFTVSSGFAHGRGHCEAGPALQDAVCEVNVRPHQAVAGLSLGPLSVVLDHHVLRAGATTALLPSGFRADVWHQLLVYRNRTRVDVFLDATHVLSERLSDTHPARLGLVSDGNADFDGVAVTAAWRDMKVEGDSGWSTITGAWKAPGRLEGSGMASKGEPALAHEFSTTLQWLGGAGHVGGGVRSDQHTVVGSFDKNIWPLARFSVSIDGRTVAASPLPRGFLYQEPHVLRVCQSPTGVDFVLDGQPAASVDVQVGPSVPCVVATGTRAAFSDCQGHHVETSPNLLHNAGFETEQWLDSGAAAPGNPWQTEGSARAAWSGLSGLRRMVILAPGGAARQGLPGLEPGHYVLRGMVHLHGATHAQVSVEGQATPLSVPSDTWAPFEVAFDKTASGDMGVDLSATPEAGAMASFDDLYLTKE